MRMRTCPNISDPAPHAIGPLLIRGRGPAGRVGETPDPARLSDMKDDRGSGGRCAARRDRGAGGQAEPGAEAVPRAGGETQPVASARATENSASQGLAAGGLGSARSAGAAETSTGSWGACAVEAIAKHHRRQSIGNPPVYLEDRAAWRRGKGRLKVAGPDGDRRPPSRRRSCSKETRACLPGSGVVVMLSRWAAMVASSPTSPVHPGCAETKIGSNLS